jgi:hypothetical protein
MRVLVTGDRLWVCNRLAAAILRRLVGLLVEVDQKQR